jgi:hypothetical protein
MPYSCAKAYARSGKTSKTATVLAGACWDSARIWLLAIRPVPMMPMPSWSKLFSLACAAAMPIRPCYLLA